MSEEQILDYATKQVSQAVNRMSKKFHETVDQAFSKLGTRYNECLKLGNSVSVCQQKYTYIIPEVVLDTHKINQCINKARVQKQHPLKEIDKCIVQFQKNADKSFESIVKDTDKLNKL